jgi:hypothetical protein
LDILSLSKIKTSASRRVATYVGLKNRPHVQRKNIHRSDGATMSSLEQTEHGYVRERGINKERERERGTINVGEIEK